MRTGLLNRIIRNKALTISTIWVCIMAIFLATYASMVNATANGRPGTPSVSLERDSSAVGDDYTIVMNMWWGNNGNAWRLYENGVLVWHTSSIDNSPNMQKAYKKFLNKPHGIYKYRCELINSYGASVSSEISVTVKAEIPAASDTNLSQDNSNKLETVKGTKQSNSTSWLRLLFNIWHFK